MIGLIGLFGLGHVGFGPTSPIRPCPICYEAMVFAFSLYLSSNS